MSSFSVLALSGPIGTINNTPQAMSFFIASTEWRRIIADLNVIEGMTLPSFRPPIVIGTKPSQVYPRSYVFPTVEAALVAIGGLGEESVLITADANLANKWRDVTRLLKVLDILNPKRRGSEIPNFHFWDGWKTTRYQQFQGRRFPEGEQVSGTFSVMEKVAA